MVVVGVCRAVELILVAARLRQPQAASPIGRGQPLEPPDIAAESLELAAGDPASEHGGVVVRGVNGFVHGWPLGSRLRERSASRHPRRRVVSGGGTFLDVEDNPNAKKTKKNMAKIQCS